jgi:rhamnogalacturonan endolyase
MKQIFFPVVAGLITAAAAPAQNTPPSQMEKLDRGVVALPLSGTGNFISWRMLGTDDEDATKFDLLRDGVLIKSNLYETNYKDNTASRSAMYQVVTKVNGVAQDTTKAVGVWTQVYNPIKLDRPAAGKTKPYTTTIDSETVSFPNGQDYTYSPNDMSVGDVDGDGQYELFVKWDPSNSKDNSQNGVTGIVYIDCYRLDGTKLWRIDLGKNIRAGAHYTQFMVYDFDGDGRAELMCKTAPGSVDGQGNYVNQAATDAAIRQASNTKDWASEGAGRINGGQEYLTVFDGETGRAIHTIAYYPNRNAKAELSEAAGTFNWGGSNKNDTGSYGNRGERYLAAVAYIDGPGSPASGIFCRGYYTYAYVWAVSFDGQQLRPRWLHASESTTAYKVTTWDAEGNATTKSYSGLRPTNGSGSGTMYANGNHNLSVADVDGDGCDEIVWGSAGCDNDGRLLYGTGFGHGDAIHLSDLDPTRPGLEVFQVHEEKGTYAWDVHDAATGAILFKGGPSGVDNGRGMAAQLDAAHHGFYFSSSSERQQRSAVTGNVASSGQTSLNFRIYWDDDLQDELLDGTKIDKWNGNGTKRLYINSKNPYDYNSSSSCNSTKATPCLQADIFGDWREEIILWSTADNATINIFSTNTSTAYRMPTLMHDHVYRMGVCWQNTAYNQPPHLGYYLPDAMAPRLVDNTVVSAVTGQEASCELLWRYAKSASLLATLLPDGTRKAYNVPEGFTRTVDSNTKTIAISGTPQMEGDYRFAIKLTGYGNEVVNDTIVFRVGATQAGIAAVDASGSSKVKVYDTAGHLVGTSTSGLPKGLYIIRRESANGIKATKVVIADK